MQRHLFALLFVLVGCKRPDTAPRLPVPSAAALRTVGPRLLSNATSTPLAITGLGLDAGAVLSIGPPANLRLALEVVDDQHGWARFPPGVELGLASEAVVSASLEGSDGGVELRLINDTRFPDLVAMVGTNDGSRLVLISETEDRAYVVEIATQKVSQVAVGDRPSAVAAVGTSGVVVVHRGDASFTLIDFEGASPVVRTVPGPAFAESVIVDGDLLFVAEHVRDSVIAYETGSFRERWRAPVAPNPRALAMTRAGLAVGSLQTGEVELLERATGKVLGVTEPGPGTPIVGGTTEAFAKYVMNGKAPRALAASKALDRLFLASIGPNIGPNPEKMEVSMNGGVAALSLPAAKSALSWQRHLGFGAGVTEALALDEARQLLFASDVGLGLIRVVDARKLAGSDTTARGALLQELALPPPDRFPRIRADEDFNVRGRAGPSLHCGPKALVLAPDGKTLFVLERFTGSIAVIDVRDASKGKAVWKAQWPVVDVLGQKTRRLGQILYFADLGRTAMSCDACHLEGHGEGVLFEKTTPLRIYRSTTVRGSRETPPYFTPASTHSMGETAKVVGSRNRYQNPTMTDDEIEALTLFSSLIPTPPNPFRTSTGGLSDSLALPDGQTGSPRRGLSLFEGKARCATCHPAPQFTLDQDLSTRGQFLDVGTPHAMPLRTQWQDSRFAGFGTPALVGAWDVFPMLTTGLAGLEVVGERVRVKTRFPLRAAVEEWAPTHGRADLLTPSERNDLLAYVLSL